jgi:hypothetical protein
MQTQTLVTAMVRLLNKRRQNEFNSKRNKIMVRPWLKDGNGNKKKFGGQKKQLAAAQTRKLSLNGRPHGVMPKRKRGHGWTTKKTSTK